MVLLIDNRDKAIQHALNISTQLSHKAYRPLAGIVLCYQNKRQPNLPPLLASLFAPSAATKFNHILTGFTLSTLGLLTNLKGI